MTEDQKKPFVPLECPELASLNNETLRELVTLMFQGHNAFFGADGDFYWRFSSGKEDAFIVLNDWAEARNYIRSKFTAAISRVVDGLPSDGKGN